MKVAIILDSMIRAGAERQAFYATRELARTGIDVELIYYNSVENAYDPGFLPRDRVVHLAKNGRQLRFIFEMQTYFRRKRFDVVHGWMSMPGVYAALAGRLARVPVIFAGFRCEYDGTGLYRLAHRAANRLATGWVVNSRATVPSLQQGVGADPNKVYVVYNGIDPSAFVTSLTRAEARKRLSLPEDGLTVSIVGRLRPQKNHPLFIKMAARVAKEVPDTRFLVVGDGDGDEQDRFTSLAAQLGVAEHVVFLGSRSDIPDILAATDVMTLTSHYEGVANSLLEAMCVGLPVVSTAYAGIDELVTHEQEGLVAPLGDAEALAHHVIRLLKDRTLREQMGARGRQTIRERFSMEAMGRNLLSVYEKCLSQVRERSA